MNNLEFIENHPRNILEKFRQIQAVKEISFEEKNDARTETHQEHTDGYHGIPIAHHEHGVIRLAKNKTRYKYMSIYRKICMAKYSKNNKQNNRNNKPVN